MALTVKLPVAVVAQQAVLELQGVFFAPNPNATYNGKKMRGNMLRPDAASRWAALLPEIQPLIAKKILIGFMLGDEIVWNNVSWVDLNATVTNRCFQFY